MPDTYRVFGSEFSPYSVKVRSYFRYKRIPHEWLVRSAATGAEQATIHWSRACGSADQ